MRFSLIAGAASAGLLLLTACSGGEKAEGNATASTETQTTGQQAASAGGAMPKAGLWELKVSAAGAPAQTTKVCTGEVPAGSNPFAPPTPGQNCSKNNVTKTADGYAIAMECTVNGMTVASNGTVSGDMSSAYKVEMTTTMGGANLPAAAQREMKTVIDAKYAGACPAGMQPGQTQS